MALGDVAGLVDAGKEERHALQPGPLQCRQAVRDLLDGGTETVGQQFQVVAQRAAPLSDSPPGRSPVIRLRAEARSASGALSAKEWVLQIDNPPPNRPYATLMLRRVDQKWLLPRD